MHSMRAFLIFFRDEPELCVASDTVSSLQWRRLTGSIATEELPDDYMIPLVSLMFEQSLSAGFTTWSLAPCKSGRNMQPGHMSYKCGLLDGNCWMVTFSEFVWTEASPLNYKGHTTPQMLNSL